MRSFVKEVFDFFSFKTRRRLLWAVLISSIIMAFYWNMPAKARQISLPTYIVLVDVAFIANSLFFVQFTRTFGTFLVGRRYKPIPYATPEVEALKNTMGISRKVKVYLSDNPNVQNSAFTNIFTSRVYIPTSWTDKFHTSEVISVIAHEFGHIKRRWQFAAETAFALGLAYGIAMILNLFVGVMLLLVYEILEIATGFLLFSFVSRRGEYRADMEGGKAVGPEGLISVFEALKVGLKSDDGSETHPPISKRILKLKKLFDKISDESGTWIPVTSPYRGPMVTLAHRGLTPRLAVDKRSIS